MEERLRLRNHKFIWRVLASFFMSIVLLLHAPLHAEAVNLDVSVSFYDLGITVEDYLSTLWGSYDSKLIGSYNVYDSSLQSYVKKDVYIWTDSVMSSTGSSASNAHFMSSNTFYVDAPFESKPGTYPNMYFPNDASRNAHVLTAFTPSGNGMPTLGIDYFPSSTGMSYSEPLPDVGVAYFRMRSSGVLLSGSSVAALKVTFYIYLDSALPEGSYFVPLYSGSYPTVVEGSMPSFLGSPERYSLFDVVKNDIRKSVNVTAVDVSGLREGFSIYFDSAKADTIITNDLFFFVGEDVSAFDFTVHFVDSSLPRVFRADSNNILGALQQGNADANQNAQDIMHSYDKSSQDSDNARFESSRQELQEQEDSLFSSAMDGFGSLDMEDYSFGKFSAMLDAFSFVSGFMQSCFVKMGDFGVIVTIGLVVMIATKVIGLYRFSTGGDSS